VNAIYNEIEPFAADWLDGLIAAGHISTGRVDRRSISDLTATDVAGSGQRHFFAGIGGWSYALRLAGVPDDADVWTGSCPCQPFSSAGARGGTSDPRHLWPAWFALIEQCRPSVIFGEQVASQDGLAWLDLVFSDLERCGYAVGAADLCAASVGAPHIRQRLYFVAYADSRRCAEQLSGRIRDQVTHGDHAHGRGEIDLADATEPRREPRGTSQACNGRHETRIESGRLCAAGGMDNAGLDGARQHPGKLPRDEAQHALGRTDGNYSLITTSAARGFWSSAEWVPCIDGVARPVEPGTFPLAHGVSGRVGRLRGYGNAIVPQVAAAFVRAAYEAAEEMT